MSEENTSKTAMETVTSTTKEEAIAAMVDVPTKTATSNTASEATSLGASGTAQVMALMEKNFLTKARTPGATLAELASPVLMMLVLWVSYNLTDSVAYPARYYHALNLDLPFFWDSGSNYAVEDADMADQMDFGGRRGLTAKQEDVFGLEEGVKENEGEEEEHWTWAQLLKDMSKSDMMEGGGGQPEEEMGMINDLLLMNHLKRGLQQDIEDEDDWMSGPTSPLEDDDTMYLLDDKDDEEDSGDWYEEIMTDLKKETVDKVDWEEVINEMQDNFGGMFDEAVPYMFEHRYGRMTHSTLNTLRLRLKDFLRRPMVVPTFGQYVWASKMLSSAFNVRRNLPRALEDSAYGRQWGNLLTLGTIHLAPKNHPMIPKFMDYLNETYPAAKANVLIRLHDDQDAAMTFVMDHLDDERTWAVIDMSQLHDTDSNGDDEQQQQQQHGGSFTIRLNHTTVPNTALVENYVASGLSTKYQRYYLSGYLTLQRTINDFVLSESGCEAEADPFFSMPMPTAAYDQNLFFLHVGYLMGLILVMAFLYPTSRLIQGLVEERETRMKETLLILGVRPWAHTTSWVLTSAISFVFITCFMSIVLCRVLTHTEFCLVWFWLALFGMASMSFCFFLASFFSKAKLAAVIGPMALFASLLPRFVFFGTNRYEAIGAKYMASILPGTALAFGADIIGDYEYGEQSVSANFWVGDYSFGTSIFFLAFDTVFFMVLAWYTEQVVPREYGAAPKPWYFPLIWCLPSSLLSYRSSDDDDKTVMDENDDDLSVTSMAKITTDNNCIEQVTDPALIPRVFIKNLVKRYNNKARKPAVNHLNLTLYESQIVGLLGHNGAGKTSTVAMLTGLYPPTSGDISIYGNSVVNDLAKARQSIGICPQHDVLFGCLTVMEHLTFFSKMKGVTFERDELKERALEIGLTEDQLRTTASALSGGNKRKLSVAIALCGNPKFLILDEPTSAMDPTARRRCWQLLRKKREGRVTLLTTHFMDEAEHLSDRVAVVKEGELQCCGSPLFLKDKYNLGWNLTVVMDKPEDDEGVDCVYVNCQDRVTSFLQQFIPLTELVRRSGRELTYCFPKGSEELFAEAFDAFEDQSKDLGVSSYGIENASFEEVFLMLAEKDDNLSEASKDNAVSVAETGSIVSGNQSIIADLDAVSVASSKLTTDSGDTSSDSDTDSLVASNPLKVSTLDFKDMNTFQSMSPLRQIGLLYWKRVTVQKRDLKGAFFTIIVPVVLVALVILVLTASIFVSGPPREMSPALFENSYSSVSSGNTNTQILVGGGASARDEASVQSQYLFMNSGLSFDYPKAQVTRIEETRSSSEMSNFLLDTYNDHDHPARFGAFSVDDAVQLNINLNFSAFREQITYYSKRRSRGAIKLRDQRVDLLEVMGLTGESGRYFWRTDVLSMAKRFYAWSTIAADITVRTADLHNLTRTALNAIMGSSNGELKQVRSEYEAGLRTFVDEMYDSVAGFLESPSYQVLQDDVIQLASAFEVEAAAVLNQSSTIESDLMVMVSDLVQSAFQKLPSEKLGTKKRDVYRWKGDLKLITRNFVEDLKTIGKDAGRGTPSIYELVQGTVNDLKKLADHSVGEATAGKYTMDTVDEVLANSFKGTSDGEDFDRAVVIRELYTMINGFTRLYKVLDEPESEKVVKSTIDWIDARLLDYSDGSIQRIPTKFFVAPLVFADYILGKWDVQTISPRQAFGYVSKFLGGSPTRQDGYIFVKAKDISIDLGKVAIEFNGIYISSGKGALFDLDREIPLTLSLEALESLVPNNETAMQFQFEIPSKTSLLHNSSSAHAVAAFNQAYMENKYKACLGETRSSKTRLVSVNHPLPMTAKQSLEIKVMLSVLAGLFILIPFCYIPATFIVFLVKERTSKSKHLQLVSGVNMSSYWVSTYLWDLSLYVVLTMCIMCVFLMYGSAADIFVGSKDAFLCTLALTFGYGVSSLPFSYLLSRMFDNSSTAQISVAGIGWLTGFVTVISFVTMDSLEKTEHIAAAMQPWFRLFPAYNLGEGLMALCTSFWYREILGWDQQPLDWAVAGHSICYIYLLALPYSFLVLVLEYANDGGSGGLLGRGLRAVQFYWSRLMLHWHGIRMTVDESDSARYALVDDEAQTSKGDADDDDVTQERQYVSKNSELLRQSAPVVLVNLWKIYPPSVGSVGSCLKRIRHFLASIFCSYSTVAGANGESEEEKAFVPKQAVRGVSTAIKKGETYALLGANGAGKSTTMGMLTGDITSTNGSAYIAGHDATGGSNSGVSEARKNIGFCPQKDPLLDLMTGRETLTMFARLRGVPPKEVKTVVTELLERLTLTPHADKVTKAYSGGNKRKLSLGLALIGDPKVLLIDESSSGLDPLAKRRMWDLIEEAARSRSVILTTHSMQEAEALCTRVAIMVKGQFVCLGSVQHLKSKYMDGYSVDMFCKSSASTADVDRLETEVLSALPGCRVSERYGRFLRFEVSNVSSCLGLGTCFRRLQELKNHPDLHVENYSVSQCSLEHVFVKLVNQQQEEEEQNDHHDDEGDILEKSSSFSKASF